MDSMSDMMSSVLGDPESLQQLKELADMLKSEMSEGETPPADNKDSFDPAALMKLMSAITAAGEEDKDRALLIALKPYLAPERQEKVDKAVKLLKIYAVFNQLKDSGALNDLGKLF